MGRLWPGLGIAAEALFSRTAKLPRLEMTAPPAAIGRNTVHAMQSGLVLGYVGLIEGLVARIRAELGGRAKVVATGGMAHILAEQTTAEVSQTLGLSEATVRVHLFRAVRKLRRLLQPEER